MKALIHVTLLSCSYLCKESTQNFKLTEELGRLQSLKGTMTRERVFLKPRKTFESFHLNWKELCSVTNDGARNMAGRN
jgi:hypothetical protein